jgi:hypothetical protein
MSAVDTFKGDSDTGLTDVMADYIENLRAAQVNWEVGTLPFTSTVAAEEFPDAHFAAVFLDAAHDYASVRADLAAWRTKVKPGGIFAGHDIDSPDVQRALADSSVTYQTIGRCWIQTTH